MKRKISIAVVGMMVVIAGTVLAKAWISEPQQAEATVAIQTADPVLEPQPVPEPAQAAPPLEIVTVEAAPAAPQEEEMLVEAPPQEEKPDTSWTVLVVQGSEMKTVTFESPDYVADIP